MTNLNALRMEAQIVRPAGVFRQAYFPLDHCRLWWTFCYERRRTGNELKENACKLMKSTLLYVLSEYVTIVS